MERTSEHFVCDFSDNGVQGGEIWRGEVSEYKWGPRNAMQACVKEIRPPAGRYIAFGNRHAPRKHVFTIFEVAYPDFTLTTDYETRLYGRQEDS